MLMLAVCGLCVVAGFSGAEAGGGAGRGSGFGRGSDYDARFTSRPGGGGGGVYRGSMAGSAGRSFDRF